MLFTDDIMNVKIKEKIFYISIKTILMSIKYKKKEYIQNEWQHGKSIKLFNLDFLIISTICQSSHSLQKDVSIKWNMQQKL